MIEFAKITGNTENNYIEVLMRTGERLYAPIVVTGSDVTLPSSKWISSNKDKFLALVSYEKDDFDSPMIIGFYPVKGANSETYNSFEVLLSLFRKLVEQLNKARTNTQIGPQKFMPDTLLVLEEIIESIGLLEQDINSLKL